jgi:O-methyltransferase
MPRELCLQVKELPGNVAELGVYQGNSAQAIAETLPDKSLYLFDTFAGMPNLGVAGVDDYGFDTTDFADTSLVAVQKRLEEFPNVRFAPGIFPDSLAQVPEINQDTFCFVFLDADIYESTKSGIEFFFPRLVVGGILAVHDYGFGGCGGVQKAVDEFFELLILQSVVDFHRRGHVAWIVKREEC